MYTLYTCLVRCIQNEKDRDKKFEEWRNKNPEIAPDVCWSPRVIEIKDCLSLYDCELPKLKEDELFSLSQSRMSGNNKKRGKRK